MNAVIHTLYPNEFELARLDASSKPIFKIITTKNRNGTITGVKTRPIDGPYECIPRLEKLAKTDAEAKANKAELEEIIKKAQALGQVEWTNEIIHAKKRVQAALKRRIEIAQEELDTIDDQLKAYDDKKTSNQHDKKENTESQSDDNDRIGTNETKDKQA